MSPSDTDTHSEPETERVVAKRVEDHLESGRAAMAAIEDYGQSAVDDLARAVAWGVLGEDNRADLTAHCIRETGIGTREATQRKLDHFLKRGLADLLGEPSVGRLKTGGSAVVEVAKPVGVIGALVPSTNPVSTTAFLAMLAVKGRNAIVISPPPTAAGTVQRTVSCVREELARIDAPRDLVQAVDRPITRAKANALLERADFAHVTGSPRNVRAGETAGTPNYCVGAGNPTAVVDDTADASAAARAVAAGVTFDNGAVCTSESNAVVDERVAEAFLDGLREAGGYVCSPTESASVAGVLFEDGHRTRSLVARPATEIADAAGIDTGGDPSFLVLRSDGTPDDPLIREKLAPVVTVLRDRGFDALLGHVDRILSVAGAGHSCTLHTEDVERLHRFARRIDVCRAVVNQPGALGLPGHGNDLDASLCLGAGVWGGNQLDENLTYRHFITTTRVAVPTEAERPTEEELFGEYLAATRSGECPAGH